MTPTASLLNNPVTKVTRFVITTAPIDKDRMKDWKANGIYYFKGTPFLTGIGQEEIMEEIYELLDEWGVK